MKHQQLQHSMQQLVMSAQQPAMIMLEPGGLLS
jgi:hypothetical protein